MEIDQKIEYNYYPIDLGLDWKNLYNSDGNKPDDGANKRQIFAQNAAPTSNYKEGDIWFDADDNNTIYRANAALSWVSVKDGTIAGKTTTFRQAAIPTSLAAGDLWYDSDDGDKQYRAAAAGATTIAAGAWIRVDVGANPTLIDALATTNAPAAAGADVTLSAINGGLTVTGGGITLSGGGSLKAGQTAYNTGTGFFLGYSTSAYKFSIGNSTNYLTWDGSALSIKGIITATSGVFGSWTISGNSFTTTDDHILIGTGAGTSITTGTFNIFLGKNSGNSVTTGSRNVYLGQNVSTANDTGSDNVMIGNLAGDDMVDGGSRNVIIGSDSGGGGVGSMSDNVFIGYQVGDTNTIGDRNVVIGSLADTGGTHSDNIVIGYSALSVGANNQLVIGSEISPITTAYIGEGVVSTTPSTISLQSTGGSGTNIVGADFILAGGKGTGNAAGGNLLFQTSNAGASGTTLQSLTTKFQISTLGNIISGAQAVLATDATDGFQYIPTCAGAPTGTPTAYTGKVAMVFDTTNNKLMIYDGAWIGITLT